MLIITIIIVNKLPSRSLYMLHNIHTKTKRFPFLLLLLLFLFLYLPHRSLARSLARRTDGDIGRKSKYLTQLATAFMSAGLLSFLLLFYKQFTAGNCVSNAGGI